MSTPPCRAWLGIDISKMKFDVVLLREEGQPRHRVFQNNLSGFVQLVSWLEEQGTSQVHACLEATGRYGEALAHFLYTAGYRVSVVNPLRIKKYGESRLRRHKTDPTDAALIADFCRTQSPREWTPPDPAWTQLQSLVRYLSSVQTTLRQELNRLTPDLPEALATLLQAHIAFLKAQLATLQRDIQHFIAQQPLLKQQYHLLLSIPGIGPLTAARLLAEIPDIRRFDSARQLAAYGGTTPSHFQSGSSVHKPAHLAHTANARLRDALYFPALVAKRHNPLIRTFCQRLLAQGKPVKLVIAAAMRKLLHLVFGVLTHQQPFDPHYLEVAS